MTRLARALGVVLTAIVLICAASASSGAAVRSGTHVDHIWIHLTSQTPAIPRPGDTLTLRGEVVNGTSQTVTQVEVGLRISPTPVSNRTEIPQILAGEAGRVGTLIPSTVIKLPTPLTPGARQPFSISVPVADLGLPPHADAVFVIGVQASADVPGDGLSVTRVDLVRSFIPWFPDASSVSPSHVLWLYPLSSAPARLRDGIFLDDHLAHELSPTGRLTRLLNQAAAHPASVSWVIDPALLEAVLDMSNGYGVQAPDGTITQGVGRADAGSWLARLRTLTASAEVSTTPYANPDVVALHRAGRDVDIALATTTAAQVPGTILGRGVSSGLAWPPDGLTDDGTLDVMRAAGSRAVVLSGTHMVPTTKLDYTPSGSVDLVNGVSPLRAIVSDPALTYLASTKPAGDADAYLGTIVQGQEFLAELAMTCLELPNSPRTIVVAPSLDWEVSPAGGTMIAAITSSPFARPETLGAVQLAEPSDVPRTHLDYTQVQHELSQQYLRQISHERAQLALVRAVAPDPAGVASASLEAALTRAESASWRTEPETGERLLQATSNAIAADMGRIRILSNAPITLPGDQGVIPVTIANDLDRAARVGVRLSSTPSMRFQAADIPAVTLAPGQKETLEVSARVVGSGPIQVKIGLLTPEGAPFGKAVATQVRSAAYAHAAQWVVIAFFAALVLLMVRGALARRSAERAR